MGSFRNRLTVAAGVFGLAVCACFAVPVFLLLDTADDEVIDAHFTRDIEAFMAEYAVSPAVLGVSRENFRVYLAPGGDTLGLPHPLRQLAPGADELAFEDRQWDVRRERQGSDVLYFLFDETMVEAYETNLLWLMVLAGGGTALLALLAGTLIARRLTAPLAELAQRVSRLDTLSQRTAAAAAEFEDDEVAVLAHAIEAYHQRISQLLRREREFSADVSHELRTPLTAVYGAAELIATRIDADPAMLEPLERIKRGCVQMSAVTESLLYLARESASFGKLVESVDVAQAVADLVLGLREVSRRRGVEIRLQKLADVTVEAIPAVVNIVIGNILKNAVNHTDGDHIDVVVVAGAVVVKDFGPGMDEGVAEAVFERLVRSDSTGEEGFGIGLALVKRFCDEYGWRIDLRSERGQGTRVAIAF